MGSVTGTTSQNSSKYDYYLVYNVAFNTSQMQWEVNVSVYLRVNHYKYSGKSDFSLSIGGKVKSSFNATKTYGSNSATKTYRLGSGSAVYNASSSKRTVSVSSRMYATSGGYGPGTCKVSASLVLPAKLSSSGTLKVSDVTSFKGVVRLTDLPVNYGYTKFVKLYYKSDNKTSWTTIGTYDVADSDPDFVKTVSNLLPKQRYDFKAEVYAPKNLHMSTKLVSVKTLEDYFTIDISQRTSDQLSLEVSNLDSKVSYQRTLKSFYRVTGSTIWLPGPMKTIASNESADSIKLDFFKLEAATRYDFSVQCSYGDILLSSATTSGSTDVPPSTVSISGLSVLENTATNCKLKLELDDNILEGFPHFYKGVLYLKVQNAAYVFIVKLDLKFDERHLVIEIDLPLTFSDLIRNNTDYKFFLLNNDTQVILEIHFMQAKVGGSV